MAVTTVTATGLMITALTPKYYKALAISLLILAMAAVHVFVGSLLIELGKSGQVNDQQNHWLDAVEFISWQNPDIFEAQGNYYRQQAFIVDEGLNLDNKAQVQSLEKSLDYWALAIGASPLWPYYQLGALDVEVLLNKPDKIVQARIDSIIKLAPNERGLDKSLLEIAFIAWPKLNKTQQSFMLEKLATARGGVLKRVFTQAKKMGNHSAICVNLPWKKVRRLCK